MGRFKSCFIINCKLLTPFTRRPWLQNWAPATSVQSQIWNPDIWADTKCPAMESMCQIMFYNQLPISDTIHKWTLAPEMGRFHIDALTDVIPGHWGGHQVAWPWNRCVKSCFIIICQLLTPFACVPWLQKWAGSTSVPSKMCNPDTGVDTKYPAMEPMCQIMSYNQLLTSEFIHKFTMAPEVGRFHIGALNDVEPGHWGGH